jgi:hypothetical protein
MLIILFASIKKGAVLVSTFKISLYMIQVEACILQKNILKSNNC